jgi:putative membrane protein
MSTPRRPRETQPVRTALAWQRTGLGLLLVAGLLTRLAAERHAAVLIVPATVVAGSGLVVLGVLTPHRRRTSQLAATTGGPGHAPRAAALATGLVVLAAVCGLATDVVVRLG